MVLLTRVEKERLVIDLSE